MQAIWSHPLFVGESGKEWEFFTSVYPKEVMDPKYPGCFDLDLYLLNLALDIDFIAFTSEQIGSGEDTTYRMQVRPYVSSGNFNGRDNDTVDYLSGLFQEESFGQKFPPILIMGSFVQNWLEGKELFYGSPVMRKNYEWSAVLFGEFETKPDSAAQKTLKAQKLPLQNPTKKGNNRKRKKNPQTTSTVTTSNETQEKEDEESKEPTTSGGEGVARMPKRSKESDTETDDEGHGQITIPVQAGTKTTGLNEEDESPPTIQIPFLGSDLQSDFMDQTPTATSMLPEHSFVRDSGTELEEYPKEMVDFVALCQYHNDLVGDALAPWNKKLEKLEARERQLQLQKKQLASQKTTKKNQEKKIQCQVTLKARNTRVKNEKEHCHAMINKIKSEHLVKYYTGTYDSIESINPIPVNGGYNVVVRYYMQKDDDNQKMCNKDDEDAQLVKKVITVPRGLVREMFGPTMREKLKEIQELDGVIPLSIDNVLTEEEKDVVGQCLKKDTGRCEYRKKDELNACWVISVIHIQCLYSEPKGDYPLIEVEDNSDISDAKDFQKWSTEPFEREEWAITTELYDQKSCNGTTTFGEKWKSRDLEFDEQRPVMPETRLYFCDSQPCTMEQVNFHVYQY